MVWLHFRHRGGTRSWEDKGAAVFQSWCFFQAQTDKESTWYVAVWHRATIPPRRQERRAATNGIVAAEQVWILWVSDRLLHQLWIDWHPELFVVPLQMYARMYVLLIASIVCKLGCLALWSWILLFRQPGSI